MSNVNSNQSKELANTMSKFKTINAAKLWWASLSPQQKGATLGIIAGCGVGGYAFFAVYKTVGISTAIWAGILYGSASGACVAGISAMAFTPRAYDNATKNLGDNL